MKKTFAIALCAAVGAAASAGPDGPAGAVRSNLAPGPIPGPVGVDSHDSLNDDFDCYQPGDAISAQPGWELWGGAPPDGVVTDAFAASGDNSLHLPVTGTDVVRQFSDFDSGEVVFSINTYVRSDATNLQFAIIALNQYDGGGAGTNWSMQVRFNTATGLIESQFRSFFTDIIFDRWVELRAEIDLDADLWDLYYDDVLFAEDQIWTDGGFSSGIGIPVFQAIDLWIDTTAHPFGVYLDDVLVTRPGCSPASTCGGGAPGECTDCYADCDGSGGLDFFDFLCFQNAFAAGEPYADCDDSGSHDFFDFLCFQNEFAMGCP